MNKIYQTICKYGKPILDTFTGFQEGRLDKDECLLLNNNRKFKNIHKGKRCFILGNGPSLSNVDFQSLSEEYVFTVNSSIRMPGYELLKSNYHIWADLAFFNLRKDINMNPKGILSDLEILRKGGNKTECFVPIVAKGFFKKYRTHLKMNYFSYKLKFDENFDKEINFTQHIPEFKNVVQYAIILAVYMGFQEIYLLGCDSTAIRYWIDKERELKTTGLHCYEDPEDEKVVENITKNRKMKDILYDQYIMFQAYDTLFKYCKRRRIKLYNLTEGGLLDSIPRRERKDIIS